MINIKSLKIILIQLYRNGVAKNIIQDLYKFIIKSSPENLVEINPNLIAIKLGLSHWEMLSLVVDTVLTGLFEMQWDINCPRCSGIAEHSHSLGEIKHESYCNHCQVNFENVADQNITVCISLHPNIVEGELPKSDGMKKVDKRVQVVTVLDLIKISKFRENFSDQIPELDHSVKIRSVTLMFTDLMHSTIIYNCIGDFNAYALIKEHFDVLFSKIIAHHGGVIKTIGDAVMALFHEPLFAIKVSFELKNAINDILKKYNLGNGYGLKIGLSSGTALVVNLNKSLDIFGTTVNKAARIVSFSKTDDIALNKDLLEDTAIKNYLNTVPHEISHHNEKLKGIPGLTEVSVLKINKHGDF